MTDFEIYQVIGDYEIVDTGDDDYLVASKGDVIVNCEVIDENWFRGKNIRSGLYGLIPIQNIVGIPPNEYSELEEELVERLQEEGLNVSSPDLQLDETTNDDSEVGLLAKGKKKSFLSKFGEYVDMSSEETLNTVDELYNDEKPTNVRRMTNPLPKPPRLLQESSKGSDEGYNSASQYSGEQADTNTPLLDHSSVSRQDEAGYEVPNVGVNEVFVDTSSAVRYSKEKKKKKSLIALWKGGKGDEIENKIDEKSSRDEIRENYYDPPPHDKEFRSPVRSPSSILNVVLSLVIAIVLSLTIFLIMLTIGKLNGVLCFSVSAIVFIVTFVVPVALLHKGFFCTLALLIPSMVSNRAKIVLVVLLVVFFIVGPVFGIADKIDIASSCKQTNPSIVLKPLPPIVLKPLPPPNTQLNRMCSSFFSKTRVYCVDYHERLNYYCNRENSTIRSDQALCQKHVDYFCRSKDSSKELCTVYPEVATTVRSPVTTALVSNQTEPSHLGELETRRTFKTVLFYLLPLLILLLLSEAYNYNSVYLTAKENDNIYITQRLKELDCERKNRGLADLILPLTRIEFQTYLVRKNTNLTKDERNQVIRWLGVLFVCVFVTVTLVLLEEFIHEVLLKVQSDSCSEIYDYRSSILYRDVIYSLLGGLLFVIVVQSHVLRMRSVICDYTYPEMVETRSKHLYYKILHDRHTFAKHVRRKIQLLSEEKRLKLHISFRSKLYAVLPEALQWFCAKLIVRKCMICDSLSFRKTVECEETNCLAHYCFECHVDAGQSCLTCKTTAPVTTTTTTHANRTSTFDRSSFCV